MRIAFINPIIQTVDRPNRFWSLFGSKPNTPLATDSEVNCVQLALAMAAMGHDVSLFISDCYTPTQRIAPENNLKICYLPTRAKFLFPPAYVPLLPSLLGEIKKQKFDCIQTSELFQPSTLMCALAGPPVFVWEEMDQYFSRRLPRMAQKIYQQTVERVLRKKKVTVIPRSEASRQFLEKRGWKKTGPVIPTPVNTDLFKPEATPEEYLLVVSRLAKDRGLSFLIKVLLQVKATKPNVRLVVVGKGPEAERFQKEVKEKNLDASVETRTQFFSHQQMKQIYNGSAMTLITTVGGILPYTALESMACGKPVISRFKRGLKTVIENDKTGYLVDSAEAMAEKIILLLQNPQKRHQMGERARKFAVEHCGFQKIANRFIEVYKGSKHV